MASLPAWDRNREFEDDFYSSGSWGPIAGAQAFPPDTAWRPLHCGEQVMADGFRDEQDAIDELDVSAT